MKTSKRISIALLALTAALGTTALALAEDGAAKPHCSGEHDGKGKGAHFKQSDKNSDGFLTQDEVGAKRWDRIKIADTNNDGKVSKAELEQAHKDGKLPHGDHKKA
jgi:hypothetical protein